MIEEPISIVLVTAPARAGGDLVRTLVGEGLAACGSIVPQVMSIYRWEGEVKQDMEVLILLKTQRTTVPQLLARIEELHPYDVPEAIALPVEAGLGAYLRWVAASSNG